jgi:hypothetical protein
VTRNSHRYRKASNDGASSLVSPTCSSMCRSTRVRFTERGSRVAGALCRAPVDESLFGMGSCWGGCRLSHAMRNAKCEANATSKCFWRAPPRHAAALCCITMSWRRPEAQRHSRSHGHDEMKHGATNAKCVVCFRITNFATPKQWVAA